MINDELNELHIWLSVNKLSINIDKTKYIIFKTKNKVINYCDIDLKINDASIERVANFNFLGLTIDECVSWKPHICKVSFKLNKFSGILCRLKRYLPQHKLKLLYCSMIQPHLSYCILAWGFDCNRLVKTQKKIIRNIFNVKYNAHTEPLFKRNNLLKISDIFKVSCLSFYYKLCN